MTHFASKIVGHYEKHAIAWDRDRQNSYWNDKAWHDRFIGRLGKGAKGWTLAVARGAPSVSAIGTPR
jgi:hypothetical protein